MNKSKVKLISVALVSAIVGGSLIFILNNINGNNYVPTENRVFDNKQFDNVNIEDTLVFLMAVGFMIRNFYCKFIQKMEVPRYITH